MVARSYYIDIPKEGFTSTRLTDVRARAIDFIRTNRRGIRSMTVYASPTMRRAVGTVNYSPSKWYLYSWDQQTTNGRRTKPLHADGNVYKKG